MKKITMNNDPRLKTRATCFMLATLIVLTNTLFSFETRAGGLDGFMKFAERGGSMTSVNRAAIVQDQRTGYMTGGSIISRGPRPKTLQPLQVQLPSANLDGCTGSADIRFGGFSYIKGKEFMDFFKGVGTAAGSYVMKMAIKQVCTHCEGIMSDLEAIARDINGLEMDQCAVGKALAGGVMGKFNAASEQKCLSKAALKKSSSDLHEARSKCKQDPDRYGEAGDDKELKSMLPDNYNLVWKALSNGGGGSTDMKELLMSISGSIIGKKKDGVSTISTLSSLLEKEDLLERYIGKPGIANNTVKLYVCDETKKCLNPKVKEIKISSRGGTLYTHVEKLLRSILDKIDKNKGVLTDEETALIEFSQTPIINHLEIELALRDKKSVASFAGDPALVELICYDFISNFMRKLLMQARSAVDELGTAQIDNISIDRFNKNVEHIQNLLRDKEYSAMNKLKAIISMKERLNQQQRVFEMEFTRFNDSN
jgi:conjugative transfer pilus assembly protein TraH